MSKMKKIASVLLASSIAVTALEARSYADRLGLEEGDVIVGVNRTRVTTVSELRRAIEDREGVIALNVRRGTAAIYLVIR